MSNILNDLNNQELEGGLLLILSEVQRSVNLADFLAF